MPFTTANGVRTYYEVSGNGPPLLLIAGNGMDHTAFRDQVPSFAGHFRCVTYDLRGIGQSDVPEAGYTVPDMARDALALLDALGCASAHIAGYSLGGYVVSQLLTLHPERFLSATLVAGSGRFNWDDARARLAEQEANERERECISRSMLFRLAPPNAPRPSEDSLKALSATCFADTTQDRFALAALTRSRADQAITLAATVAVKVPTLAVVGTDDPEKAGLDALVQIRPSVKLVIINGATHAGPRGILSRPELIAALRAFLSAHPEK